MPTTITVHLGKPKESARNVTVSFRHYIANVASSEVYPTWPGVTKPANLFFHSSKNSSLFFGEYCIFIEIKVH